MKNLITFITQQNFRATVFGGKQLDVTALTPADRTQLADALDSALSPENLVLRRRAAGPRTSAEGAHAERRAARAAGAGVAPIPAAVAKFTF